MSKLQERSSIGQDGAGKTGPTTQLTIPPTAEDGGRTLLPWLREMRDKNPVWRDVNGVWHVFRYADVERVITDPQVFSSDVARLIPALQRFRSGNLLLTDPPRHHQLRRLVGAAVSPGVVTGLAPRIAEVTHEMLDSTGGTTEFDLVSTLAYPLPASVLAELLGLPVSDRELFRTWVDELFTFNVVDPNDPELARKIDAAIADMMAYLHEHCVDRRAHPREDLISRLVTVEVDGERLTNEEVMNFYLLLLLAGHVTTTALIGNTMLCLDANPEVWAELHADRSLVEATLEEVLRYRSSFIKVDRVTMTETELGGQVIPADAFVSTWLLSANLDEREFPDPDRFDIHRSPRHHLAFGYGIHSCMGRLLARVEAKTAIDVLLDRYAEINVLPSGPQEFFPYSVFAARNIPVSVRHA